MIRYFCYILVKYVWSWRIENNLPKDLKSFVMIGAPHTSNLDFFVAMAIAYGCKIDGRFIIKESWIRFPMKNFFRSVGAMGINRELINQGVIKSTTDYFVKLFAQDPNFVLMIAPEGTRSANAQWRTGFYFTALKAKVPIVLAYGCYKKKIAGISSVLYPSGDLEADMKIIKDFYRTCVPRVPEKFAL